MAERGSEYEFVLTRVFAAPNGFWPLMNGGTDAVFYCFLWLYFSAAGAGSWSVDAIRAPSWPKTPRSR